MGLEPDLEGDSIHPGVARRGCMNRIRFLLENVSQCKLTYQSGLGDNFVSNLNKVARISKLSADRENIGRH